MKLLHDISLNTDRECFAAIDSLFRFNESYGKILKCGFKNNLPYYLVLMSESVIAVPDIRFDTTSL